MNEKILLFVLLGGFLVLVRGVVIYTASEVEAVNGTDVKLKCIFDSSAPVSLHSVMVFWEFQPLHRRRQESVFLYRMRPYPPSEGRFRKRVVWSGDIMNKDASITLQQVSPDFGGTYTCQVHNIPDVHGRGGEVFLRVVNKTASIDSSDFFLALFDLMGI